jgi:hypothetical protein
LRTTFHDAPAIRAAGFELAFPVAVSPARFPCQQRTVHGPERMWLPEDPGRLKEKYPPPPPLAKLPPLLLLPKYWSVG